METTKVDRCLAILEEGPATTAEVAAETGMTAHNACGHLFNLYAQGRIKRTPYYKPGDNRRYWLWQPITKGEERS